MADRYIIVHQNPQGLGDARPTAIQIVKDEELEGKYADKVIFITGCSSGIGVETANALALTGAKLYLTARDLNKARAALGDLAQSDRVHLFKLDLSSLDSVRSCVKEFLVQEDVLNILICNAGVMNTPKGLTIDGFETQFGTNHLAHFLLINLLTTTLVDSSTSEFASRVVIVTSMAHRFDTVHFDNLNLEQGAYTPNVAYAQSKLANLWTSNELERRYGRQGLHSWAVQPGGVATNIQQHMSEEQRQAVLAHFTTSYKTPAQGAATSVWASTAAALEGKGGRYLENCQIASPWDENKGSWGPGYGSHAYSPIDEARLWEISSKLVKLA